MNYHHKKDLETIPKGFGPASWGTESLGCAINKGVSFRYPPAAAQA